MAKHKSMFKWLQEVFYNRNSTQVNKNQAKNLNDKQKTLQMCQSTFTESETYPL